MKEEKDVYDKIADEQPIVVTGKDIIALILATMSILLPYVIGASVIFYFILLFCSEVWLK